MAFTDNIEVRSPYELLLVGMSNYLSRRLDIDEDTRDFQYLDEKKIEAFKYAEVIAELAYKGFIQYEFSKHFKVKGTTRFRALDEKYEDKLGFFYNKDKDGFFVTEEDLREDEVFAMLRMSAGYDFSLTVVALTIDLLSYKFGKQLKLNFVGDNIDVYLREASTMHYYKTLGYLTVQYDVSEKVLNTLNANIFKSIAVINGYMGSDLVSYYDKIDMMKKQNISRGSVVYLYKKHQEQLTVMNDIVDDCTLAVVEDYGAFGIKLKQLPVRTSYEFVVLTYSKYSDDVKDLYGGLENFLPYNSKSVDINLTWPSCGVSYVQNSKPGHFEEYFITNLKMVTPVTLNLLLNSTNTLEKVVLQAPEAVYFLLLQYQRDFDKDLFKKEYPLVDYKKVEKLVKTSKKNIEKILGYKLRR